MCKWSVCIARGCSRLWLRDCGVASSSNTRENGGTESGCTAATFLPCVYIMLSSPRISFMYPNGDGAGTGANASAPSPFVSLPDIALFLFSLARLKWILPSGNYLAHNSNKNREGEKEKREWKMHLNMLSALYKHDNCWNSYLYSFLIAWQSKLG